MCIVIILFKINPYYPLIVAANRDEDRTRPTKSPHQWDGTIKLWAGRDEIAGGTWLGVNEKGLLAAVTNRETESIDITFPSRGLLCLETLRQSSTQNAKQFFRSELQTKRYNPFNLLCASPKTGWISTHRGSLQALKPGVHVLSNHGDMDKNKIPVVNKTFMLLSKHDFSMQQLDRLLFNLGEICADTTGEYPICRIGGTHGTVSSSIIALKNDGTLAAYLHADGEPSQHRYTNIKHLQPTA